MIQSTHIYIDGGDPHESREADKVLKQHNLGGLDGQTTNPTLIAKNALKSLQAEKSEAKSLTASEAAEFYKKTVQEIASVAKGPISIQVIGNPDTMTAEDMLHQARERLLWIPQAVIKFPCTKAGLTAAEVFCQEGPVNMTLVFSQEQAAAVYAATKHHNYDVYVSPFVGRLDDIGQNGMDLVANIIDMYKLGDGHVKVLTASTRTLKHILYALRLKSDIITIPYSLFIEWSQSGTGASFAVPPDDFVYDVPGLTELPYREITLDLEWSEYDISHNLTDRGITKFWEDWSHIVTPE